MKFDDFYRNVRSQYPDVGLDQIREAYTTKFDREPIFEQAPDRDQFRIRVADTYPGMSDEEIDDKYDEIYNPGLLSEVKRSALRGMGNIAGNIGGAIQVLQDEFPKETRGAPGFGIAKTIADMLPSGQMIRDYWKEQGETVPKSGVAQGDVLEDPVGTLTNPNWWAAGVPEVLASQAATIGGFMMGGPVGAGIAGGALEGLSTYGTAKDAGLDNPLLRGAGMGAATGVLNAIPFAKPFLGGGLVQRGLTQGVAEGFTEGLEEYPGTYLETEAAKWDDYATLKEATRRAVNVAPLAAVTGGANAMVTGGGAAPNQDFLDVTSDLMKPTTPDNAEPPLPKWAQDLADKGQKPYLPQPGVKKVVLPKSEQKRVALETILAPIHSKWKGGPKVNVVASFRNLPQEIQDRFDDGINGAYDGSENVYLIADKFDSPQEAARVLYHESLGHYSIEQIIPDIDTFAADVARLAPSDPVLAKYWEDVTTNEGYAKEEPMVQALEVVAKYSEDFPNTKHPLVERAYSRLREFGRRLGLDVQMNRADLNLALRKAMRNLERGTKNPTARTPTGEMKASDYRGMHKAPGREGAAPAHDLTQIYPDDVYGPMGMRYYGTGDRKMDSESYEVLSKVRGRPNAKVTIYRAVPYEKTNAQKAAQLRTQMDWYMRRRLLPAGVELQDEVEWYEKTKAEIERLETAEPSGGERYPINPGDWVTLSRAYAKQHGETTLGGKYRIEKKTVRASEIFTNGDSWNEFGYAPEGSAGSKASRPTMRSDGKPIHPTEEGVRNFWEWFGDSKMVDSQGRPLVVYHGSKYGLKNFDRPNKAYIGRAFFTTDYDVAKSYSMGETPTDDVGIFSKNDGEFAGHVGAYYVPMKKPITEDITLEDLGFDEEEAAEWRDPDNYRSSVHPFSASMEDGSDLSIIAHAAADYPQFAKTLRELGYDGFMYDDLESGGITIIPFEAVGIKSATGNSGQFNPKDSSIKASRPPYPATVETFDDRALQSVVRAAEFDPKTLQAFVAIAKGQEGRIETQRRGVQSWTQTERNAAELLASDMGFKHVASLVAAAPGTAANPESLMILAGAVHEATEMVESAAATVMSDRSPANLAALKAAMDRLAYLQAPWMGMRAEAGRALNILRKVAPIAQNVNSLVDAYVHNPEALEATAKTIVEAKAQSERENPAAPVEREIAALESQKSQLSQDMAALQEQMRAMREEVAAAQQEAAAEPAAVDRGLADLEAQNKAAAATRADAARQVKKIEIEIAKLRKQQSDILALEAQADAAAQEKGIEAQDLEARRLKLRELKARNAKEKARIDAGLKSLQAQQQAAVDAQARLEQAARNLEAQRAEMLERRRAVAKGESQTKAKLQRVQEQLRKVEERERALAKQQQELEAKRGELQKRRDALRKQAPRRRTTASIVREEYVPTLGDKFLEYYYNSILSGPATHLVNIFGNAAFQITEEIAKQAGLRATGQSRAATARLNAITLGIQTGLRNARNAFATELPQLDQQTKMEIDPQLRAAIPGQAGKVVRLPGRALQAEDEFFKGISYTMEIAQLATQAAQGDMQRAREIMADPPLEMQQDAVLAARRATFTSKVGPSARSLMTFLNKVKPAKLVIPFVQTPVNIMKRAMDYSPFGLSGVLMDTEIGNDLRGRNGAERQAVAVARQALGGGVALMLWQLAAAGLVTGGGPPDPQERTLWRQRDGRDVYSVKIGDQWVSYLRFDPLAIPMGVMADLYEAVGMLGERDAEDIALTVMNSLVNNVANKTWLSGVSSFAEAINDPQRYGEGFLGMLASGIAVPNIVGQVTNYNDPYMRQARTVLDRVRSRIPGERQELARKVGIAGQDLENNGVTMAGIPTPLRATDATPVDPLADAMLRLGVIKQAPSRNFMGVELTDEEHYAWSQMIQQNRWRNLTPIVQSPQFNALPPIVQASQLEKLWTKFGSNEYARAVFLMQHPEVLDRIRKARKKAG